MESYRSNLAIVKNKLGIFNRTTSRSAFYNGLNLNFNLKKE